MNSSRRNPLRADGALARQRLLQAALALFAEKGFAKASTREIAEAACCNQAAICYYFGDKRGLYQAVLSDIGNGKEGSAPECATKLAAAGDMEEALRVFFRAFLKPITQGVNARLVTRLHFREMLEPVGLKQVFCNTHVFAQHDAMRTLLSRYFEASMEDVELVRLAFAIQGVGVYFFLADAEKTLGVSASGLSMPESLEALTERFTLYALGMIRAATGRLSRLGKSLI